MLIQVAIFLSLLYILHDRTYFSYRPFFYYCSSSFEAEPDDNDSCENPKIPHPIGTPVTTPAPINGAGKNDTDVVLEEQDVRRYVEKLSSAVMHVERITKLMLCCTVHILYVL